MPVPRRFPPLAQTSWSFHVEPVAGPVGPPAAQPQAAPPPDSLTQENCSFFSGDLWINIRLPTNGTVGASGRRDPPLRRGPPHGSTPDRSPGQSSRHPPPVDAPLVTAPAVRRTLL